MPQAPTKPATEADLDFFSTEDLEDLQKEVSSGGGRFINPSKIEGETRLRCFGPAIKGFEGWTTDDKPVRWAMKPQELPENIRRRDDGKDPLKPFMALLVWEYDSSSFKVLQMTQKTLITAFTTYALDKDNWGSYVDWDFKINREGEGLNTKYSFSPLPPKKVGEEAASAFAALTFDITKMFDGEDPFAEAL